MIVTFLIVILFSLVKEGIETHNNKKGFEVANSLSAKVYDYGNFKFKSTTFSDIKVGDVVLVERDQELPADVLLVLSSNESIYVDTTKIDGESSLKQKFPFIQGLEFSSLQFFQGMITCSNPTPSFDEFSG